MKELNIADRNLAGRGKGEDLLSAVQYAAVFAGYLRSYDVFILGDSPNVQACIRGIREGRIRTIVSYSPSTQIKDELRNEGIEVFPVVIDDDIAELYRRNAFKKAEKDAEHRQVVILFPSGRVEKPLSIYKFDDLIHPNNEQATRRRLFEKMYCNWRSILNTFIAGKIRDEERDRGDLTNPLHFYLEDIRENNNY